MIANLSSHNAGWDDRREEFSDRVGVGQVLLDELLHPVDEDTEAFHCGMGSCPVRNAL